MNCKKFFVSILSLFLAVSFIGCSISNEPEKEQPSSQINESEQSQNIAETYLTGYSLSENGYILKAPELKNETFWTQLNEQNPEIESKNLTSYIELVHYSNNEESEPFINGAYDDIVLNIRYSTAYQPFSCMYLQFLYNSEMTPEAFIKIGNENYTIDQISENILYEDDDIIIFDFFPYLNVKPIEQILNQKIQEENNLLEQSFKEAENDPEAAAHLQHLPQNLNAEDYQYLIYLYKYCRAHFSEFIIKDAVNNS